MSPLIEEALQWRGTNFPELYEWLTKHSTTKNFKLKVTMPGRPHSSIEITIDNIKLCLNVEDWIIKNKDGIYYVVEDEE